MMQGKTDSWLKETDAITEAFKTSFGHLDGNALNQAPAGAWSIAQNMDHLITTNESYFDIPGSIRSGQYKLPFLARFGFLTRFFGKLILKAVEPKRQKKMRTFPIWEPKGKVQGTEALDRFYKHQEALKQFILDCRDLLEKETLISSPANDKIVYKLETAIDILLTHEWRHFNQAKEVAAAFG